MRLLLLLSAAIWAFAGCSENKKAVLPPAAPASVEAARNTLRNHTYVVEDVGLQRHFMGREEPVQWTDELSDTTRLFKTFLDQRKSLSLHFVNDTLVKLSEEKTTTDAAWSLEKDTSAAVLMDVAYEDSSFSFGAEGPMTVTYTYKIKGIDEGLLYLETPREYNRSRVVLLMKKQ